MALRFIDSWDHYNTAKMVKKGYSSAYFGASPGDMGTTIGAYGRNSTNGMRCRAGGSAGQRSLTTLTVPNVSGATAIIGFGFQMSLLPATTANIVEVWNESAAQMSVAVTTGGALVVRRGDGVFGTTLETSVATLSAGVFYFLEFKVLLHQSAGTYEVRVDGVNVMSDTGVDTYLSSGTITWDSLVFGNPEISADRSFDYDDLYVADGSGGVEDDFLGDHRVVGIVASSGNGTHTDWTCSTGSDHGALVDENPPNESDFVQSDTAGNRDTYNFAAVGVSGTVKAVQTLRYIKADAAGVRTVAPTIRISSTDYDGTGQVVGSDWIYHKEIYRQSPATSSAWTVSEIDGAEFGAKVTV